MECKAEEPTGHFLTHSPPVFELGELDEGVCDYNMLITRRCVVLPSDPLHPLGRPRVEAYFTSVIWELHAPREGWTKYSVDHTKNVGKWEAVEICLGTESPRISLTDALEDPRCQIHGCDAGSNLGKGAEATQDG